MLILHESGSTAAAAATLVAVPLDWPALPECVRALETLVP
jgi:hypothetical protein